MKRTILSLLCALFLSWGTQAQALTSNSLKSYTIVYSLGAEDEEGIEAAQYLQKAIEAQCGVRLDIQSDEKKAKAREILIGHTLRKESHQAYNTAFGPFDYQVKLTGKRLVCAGGGAWALKKAGERIAADLAGGKIGKKYEFAGSVQGEFLVPREEKVNLRILASNVWDFSNKPNPEAWEKMGANCTDSVRAPQFAQLIRAYMPDVIGFQEFSREMTALVEKDVAQYGYKETFVPEGNNDTPIWYNENTVELIETQYVRFVPALWSNGGSKGYSYGVFRHKGNGKTFILFTTHLWWKGEKVQAGSNTARAAQAHQIVAHCEYLKAQYDCPIFVVGDMNCTEKSKGIRMFLDNGFTPCYQAASGFSDPHNGHHRCNKNGFGRDRGNRTRAEAIDHCFIYNGKETQIRHFICEMSAFTVKITDHYPNIIDVIL